MAGLVPAIHALLLKLSKKDVDAREDGVPAALRGGVSLRGHDGGEAIRSLPSPVDTTPTARNDAPAGLQSN